MLPARNGIGGERAGRRRSVLTKSVGQYPQRSDWNPVAS